MEVAGDEILVFEQKFRIDSLLFPCLFFISSLRLDMSEKYNCNVKEIGVEGRCRLKEVLDTLVSLPDLYSLFATLVDFGPSQHHSLYS